MDPRNSQGPDRVDYRENPGDLTEVHASIQREHRDPTAESTPIPLWLAGLCGAALVWAGGYFMTFHGGLRADVYNERQSSPELIFATKTANAGKGGQSLQKADDPVAAGKAVYANCAPCHQPTGQGGPGIPSLIGTEYVKSEKRLIALLLKGIQGPMEVNGTQYNGVMPAWEKTLSDKKIAQVASYVRASFGNSFPVISDAAVSAARKEFAAQAQPWTAEQLMQMPGDISSGTPAAAPAAGGAQPAATAAGGATPAAAGGAAAQPAAAKPAVDVNALMTMGKAQYGIVCQACHQPTGGGLPPVFPPLAGSEWVTGDPKRMVSIILHGLSGPIKVAGKDYNNMMPGQGAVLNDQKIAAIATYVRNSFGNKASEITPDLVAQLRKEHSARTTPWTAAELEAIGGGTAAPAAAPAP